MCYLPHSQNWGNIHVLQNFLAFVTFFIWTPLISSFFYYLMDRFSNCLMEFKFRIGPAQNIKTITKEHLKNYRSTHYTAPRMVISAAGAVKHEDIVDQVKKLFTNLSNDPPTASQLVAKEPAIVTGSEVRIIDDDIPLAQFAVAFSGASWTDPDSIALMVMQSMLGSWNKNTGSGKHMGIAHNLMKYVVIHYTLNKLIAYLKDIHIYFCVCTNAHICIKLSFGKIDKFFCSSGVDKPLNNSIWTLKSSLQLHIDGTSPVAEDIGRQILTYVRRIPVAELFARIDAVDANTVKRVANRFIFDQDVAIAAMGPIQGLPDYNWFRRRTYLLRH
ncbi:unnamed protein product [Musa acuminata subsp. malaccensis]|uniref:(wild Malaysian banana) hypothetical protein n=1 Tax=Musa acuminata subsp. malaccensis TaxID=214687 RepID=A0A804IX63_MUSAM|nr:unnamed protein product [Musa acuminata subsp. malaccensis]